MKQQNNMTSSIGKFTFVLHSHLPYVMSHGKWPHGMVWLSEAATETYIPLWRVFSRLQKRKINMAVTIGITPVLAEQLSDPDFPAEFLQYLHMKQEAAQADREEFTRQKDSSMRKIAEYWIDFYKGIEDDFRNDLNMDIIGAFRKLQDDGA
ncbi:hypothetical protein K8I28_17550, partial [bacterium]|nr:hypothetical protein [bacterium]